MVLAGRVALVTGAGRRLGRAFAAALASRGMTMALHFNASKDGAESLGRRSRGRVAGPPACRPISVMPAPRGPWVLASRASSAAGRAGELGCGDASRRLRGHDAGAL
jgi:NAD(P)-dependent dehydrogenase (short-subunit alcohol dehydrogenase family)